MLVPAEHCDHRGLRCAIVQDSCHQGRIHHKRTSIVYLLRAVETWSQRIRRPPRTQLQEKVHQGRAHPQLGACLLHWTERMSARCH